jgi:hypothetical protein
MQERQMQLEYDRECRADAFAADRGLIIRQPWADQILEGSKTWEIRGSSTHVRGRIAIIAARSKHVSGYCDLVGVQGPLTLNELLETIDLHGISRQELVQQGLPYPNTYAWILERPEKLKRPTAYRHPSGAIIWVRLHSNEETQGGTNHPSNAKNDQSRLLSS